MKLQRQPWPIFVFLTPLFTLIACTSTDAPAIIAPHGPAASQINTLWWVLLGLGTAVFLGVMLFFGYALLSRRSGRFLPKGRNIIIGGGVVMPTVVLLVVYGFALKTLSNLFLPAEAEETIIEVIGHQFWWEVRYPQHHVITANEIRIPVGRPVLLRLGSVDVIHSLWVPELHGKHDLIPGRTNDFWLEADEAGEYRGICAEFCGVQHAKMLFRVVVQPEDEFNAWLEAQSQPAAEPTTELTQQGREVFFAAECNSCHRIVGTDALGDLGPDLTHFASRTMLGAGIAENNRGNLSGWIVNPQGLKPGNLMPASQLTSAELEALIAYLESLE